MKVSRSPTGVGNIAFNLSLVFLMLPSCCFGFMINIAASKEGDRQHMHRVSRRSPQRTRSLAVLMFSQGHDGDSMDSPSSTAAIKAPKNEILDILFPHPSGSSDGAATHITAAGDAYVAPGYEQRVAAGREAQGYTPTTDAVAARTLVPLRELTYGEYDLGFFSSLVQECLSVRAGSGDGDALEAVASELCFGDIGSGCGRLVVAQALTWPWRSCRGVEKISSLHDMGVSALAAAGRMADEGSKSGVWAGGDLSPNASKLLKKMAPCSLSLGDINEPEMEIADMDILFCYSSSFPAFGDLLTEFSYTLGHKLRPGAQVITTDRRLVSDGPWEFVLLGEREGPNPETGGKSTAYLWQVVKSAL